MSLWIKNKIFIRFLWIILLLVFNGCKKTNPEDLALWYGLWSGNQNGEIYFLSIQEKKGESSYEQVGQDIIYGTPEIDTKNNTLKIKSKTLQINSYPALNPNLQKSQASLDGIVYTKN